LHAATAAGYKKIKKKLEKMGDGGNFQAEMRVPDFKLPSKIRKVF